MHEQVEKTVLSPYQELTSGEAALLLITSWPYTAPFSGGETFWASSCWLSAMTIASLLMGGCGLSHERVEDGCRLVTL